MNTSSRQIDRNCRNSDTDVSLVSCVKCQQKPPSETPVLAQEADETMSSKRRKASTDLTVAVDVASYAGKGTCVNPYREVAGLMCDPAEKIRTMIEREKRYACSDYLRYRQDPDFDRDCRERLCQWMFSVVDHFDLRRELVSISVSYMDRFCAVMPSYNSSDLTLAASASFYMTLKIHEPKEVFLRLKALIIELSNGDVTIAQIVDTEQRILKKLLFILNPPTPVSYVFHFIYLMTDIEDPMLEEIVDIACFLTELAVSDYFFVTKRASNIAIAAVLNAVDCVFSKGVADDWLVTFKSAIKSIAPDMLSNELTEIRARLRLCHEDNCLDATGDDKAMAKDTTCPCSPVSVTHVFSDKPS